ncbi:MAG: L-fucose:H+ symporter permease [Ignavibacteria bacterium]|nr:L-fucose:H+ symporter permease [Ignavibacteria bacterium]
MATSGISPNTVSSQEQNNKDYSFPLVILTSLFFMWGFLTCLNDILIPHLKNVFELNYTQVMLTQFCFFFAYFVVSIPSGAILKRIGYQKGIVVGLVTAAIGTLLFYPAAGFREYWIFLTALFVLASGITLLQVAANPFVAILGSPKTASSRLNLTQAFNSLGTTIAPLIGAQLILSVAAKSAAEIKSLSTTELESYRLIEAAAVQTPYLWLAAILLLIAAIFAYIKLPVIQSSEVQASEGGTGFDKLHSSAWGYSHLVLGAIGIFVYVGAEVSIGSFLVNYLGQSFIAGLKEADAGRYVSYYWGGAMLGRFLGAYLQKKIHPARILGINAVTAAILLIGTMTTTGAVAMWSILAIGFFNSIMFPTIFTLAIDGLGKHTEQGSGILCMAIVGGAILPIIQGFLADQPMIGIHHAFILPVLCYGFIAYYAFSGHKLKVSKR